MKVCVFVWNDFKNDARVYRECTALVEKGFNVVLICLNYNGSKNPIENIDGIVIKRVKARFYNNGTLFKKFVSNIIPILRMTYWGIKEDADYYHGNDLNTIYQAIISSKFRFKRRVLLYDAHEVQTSRVGYGEKIIFLLEKIAIIYSDIVITTTQTRAEYLKKIYRISTVSVIHNYPIMYRPTAEASIDYRDMYNLPRKINIVLYQGGISEGRGLEKLISSFKCINDAVLVIIGNGRLESKLRKMVADNFLESKVKFIDSVPQEQLHYYTSGADIGVQLLENTCFNHYSALSNKLLEYIMADLKIIATDLPEMRKILEGKSNNVMIDEVSEIEICKAIKNLICRDASTTILKDVDKVLVSWEMEKKKYTDLFYSKTIW